MSDDLRTTIADMIYGLQGTRAGRAFPNSAPTTGPLRGYAGGTDQPYLPYGGPIERTSPSDSRPYPNGVPMADQAASLAAALSGQPPAATGPFYRAPMEYQNAGDQQEQMRQLAARLGLVPPR